MREDRGTRRGPGGERAAWIVLLMATLLVFCVTFFRCNPPTDATFLGKAVERTGANETKDTSHARRTSCGSRQPIASA